MINTIHTATILSPETLIYLIFHRLFHESHVPSACPLWFVSTFFLPPAKYFWAGTISRPASDLCVKTEVIHEYQLEARFNWPYPCGDSHSRAYEIVLILFHNDNRIMKRQDLYIMNTFPEMLHTSIWALCISILVWFWLPSLKRVERMSHTSKLVSSKSEPFDPM